MKRAVKIAHEKIAKQKKAAQEKKKKARARLIRLKKAQEQKGKATEKTTKVKKEQMQKASSRERGVKGTAERGVKGTAEKGAKEKIAKSRAHPPPGYQCGSANRLVTGWTGSTCVKAAAGATMATYAKTCNANPKCLGFNIDTKNKNIPCWFKTTKGAPPAGLAVRWLFCKHLTTGTPTQAVKKAANAAMKHVLKSTVNFTPGRFTFRDSHARIIMNKLAAAMKKFPNVPVTIVGHSPAHGAWGLKLSSGRAHTSVNYLRKIGVKNKLTAKWKYGTGIMGITAHSD